MAGNDSYSGASLNAEYASACEVRLPVFANDTDKEDGKLTVQDFVSATGVAGAVSKDLDGNALTLVPAKTAGSDYRDTFTYTVKDSKGATDSATVTVVITVDCG